MSVANRDGSKADVPRPTPLALTDVEVAYAGRNPHRLKRLAALQLCELLGWPVGMVARMFDHAPGTVTRQVAQCKAELAERLERDG